MRAAGIDLYDLRDIGFGFSQVKPADIMRSNVICLFYTTKCDDCYTRVKTD